MGGDTDGFFFMAFEGMGQDREGEELSNNHPLKEKRGGQAKFQDKSGKIAGITYFGEGGIIPYKKFCLGGAL